MARKLTWGTPSRSEHYLKARPAYGLLRQAALLGGALAAALLALHAVGFRRPLAPGDLASAHGPVESRCQECHVPRRGTSNAACQRCHDPAAWGRHSAAAHAEAGGGRFVEASRVVFASAAPEEAGAGAPACGGCHVEHRGRAAQLSSVDQAYCLQCHFRGFAAHPEFSALKRTEAPGIKFDHSQHISHCVELGGVPPQATCVQCHEPDAAGRDFVPVTFASSCAACHEDSGSIGTVDWVPQEDALPPATLLERGVRGAWLQHGDEFQTGGGKISKTTVHHKDEWVLYNVRRLRREVDPQGYSDETARLLQRLDGLQRQLALVAPLVSQDVQPLKKREAELATEVATLEARLAAPAGEPASGLERLEAAAAALAQSGDAMAAREAEALRRRASGMPPASPTLGPEALEARRLELLQALDALEVADPAAKGRLVELRRRIVELQLGRTSQQQVSALLGRRRRELERIRHELALREFGTQPPSAVLLVGQQRAIQKAIEETQTRLRVLDEGGPVAAPSEAERERKRASLQALTQPCAMCHVIKDGAFAPVAPAWPVLGRARFIHRPHLLQATCQRCHPTIEKSNVSEQFNGPGVAVCQGCHRSGGVRDDCQWCHRYHPKAGG